MKKNWLYFLMLLSVTVASQPGDRPMMSWTLKGRVLDSLTRKPLEYSTVTLFSLRDSSLVAGGVSDSKGNFSVAVPRPGKFTVKVSFLGYATRTITPVHFIPKQGEAPVIDLGDILLASSSKKLQDVVVEEKRPVVELQLDKKVVRVAEDITSAGGNALDVLKNVPGIEVDQDGNISLRGSENVLVLIDGRLSTFVGANRRAALEQIQASNIENIEIITNPSAKYNPEGMTGIINIVLKKRKGAGFNSLLTLGAGYPGNARAGVALSYSTPTYSVFGNVDGSLSKNYHYGNSERTSSLLTSEHYLHQTSNDTSIDANLSLKVGGEYYLPKKWIVGGTATYFFNQSLSEDHALSYYLNASGDETKRFTNFDRSTRQGKNVELAINFSKKFSKPKEEITGDFSFGAMSGGNSSFTRLTFWDGEQISSTYLPTWQTIDVLTTQRMFNEKINWNHFFSDSLNMEIGVESSIRNIDYDKQNQLYDFFSSAWQLNDTTSYRGGYQEGIAALYGVVNKTWKKWGFSVGLRAEYAQTNVYLIDSAEHINAYRTLYPTGAISYTFDQRNQLQLTYSKRVNRPSFFNLIPFTDYSNYPNIRKGNPFLKPEYIHSLELSYAYYASWGTVIPSLFYKHVYDVISRYRQSLNDTVFVMTWANFNTATSTGAEITFSGRFFRWWNFNVNGQYYWHQVNGENVETSITGNARGWSFKMNNSFKLPRQFDIQLTANYMGPRFTGQGTRQPFGMVNIGLRKAWLQNKLSLLLNIMDVFGTQQFKIIFDQPTYYMVAQHWHKSPRIMATLTWKLSGDYRPTEKRRQREMDMQNLDMDL